MTGENVSYSVAVLVVGFGSSFIAVVYFLFVMKFYLFNSDVFSYSSGAESRDHIYVTVLFLVSCLTLLPYAISLNITNFIPADRLKKAFINVNYYQIVTGNYDMVLTFLRYQFNVVFPFVAFVFYKEFRKQFNDLYCFCRRNSVSNQLNIPDQQIERKSKLLISEKSTPVLMSTENGLILRCHTGAGYSYTACDSLHPDEPVKGVMSETPPRERKPVSRRKIVRFSHYVKEIPPTFTEWGTSDN